MSESTPIYIACAAGNNAQADCKLSAVGDLIRLRGHPMMDFTPDDARKLAAWIERFLGRPDADPIVESVRARMLERSTRGREKYGANMTRADLDTLDWIRRAQEEAMETAIYLERLYDDIQRMTSDGR